MLKFIFRFLGVLLGLAICMLSPSLIAIYPDGGWYLVALVYFIGLWFIMGKKGFKKYD